MYKSIDCKVLKIHVDNKKLQNQHKIKVFSKEYQNIYDSIKHWLQYQEIDKIIDNFKKATILNIFHTPGLKLFNHHQRQHTRNAKTKQSKQHKTKQTKTKN